LSVNSPAPELTVRVRLEGRVKVRYRVRVEVTVSIRVRVKVKVSASISVNKNNSGAGKLTDKCQLFLIPFWRICSKVYMVQTPMLRNCVIVKNTTDTCLMFICFYYRSVNMRC